MNETVKRELLNSLQMNDHVEEQGLNVTSNNVENLQEAMLIIRCYEGNIKSQNKHFFDNVDQIRSSIYFKILFYKFLKKYTCYQACKQVIIKIILRLSRLFSKKSQSFLHR